MTSAAGRRSEWRTRYWRPRIAQRDNWTCSRCHEPIPPGLRYPHPRSCSLEHLIRLEVWDGDPYDPTNLAVSHLDCNRRAGARDAITHRHRLDTSEDW